MTHRIRLDDSRRYFRIIVVGQLTLSYIEEIVEEMMEGPDFRPNLGVLWDLRSADVRLLAGIELSLMRESRRRAAVRRGSARIALLADDDYTFGMSRMAEVSADVPELPIRVFRDEVEAEKWIREGVGSPPST